MRLLLFSASTLCFPLILPFQLVVCINADIITSAPMTDVSEIPESRRSPSHTTRFLCDNPGCTCDGVKNDTAEWADCNCRQGKGENTKINQTILKFGEVRFPPNLKTIRISDCDILELGLNEEFSKLNLAEISIQNIFRMTIRPLAFKKVAHFTVKNVAMLSFENRAFDNLEAESLRFVNVTFNKNSMDNFTHVGAISPQKIKSIVEFRSSKLSTDVEIRINQEDVSNLTVSFRDCVLEGLKSAIRTDRFELIGNKFPSLCSIREDVRLIPTPRVVESRNCVAPSVSVEFYKSLELSGNTFNHESMPDVRFNVSDKGVMDVIFPNDKTDNASTSAETAEKWLKLFDFDFKSLNKTNRGVNVCKEKWIWGPPKYQIFCPDPQSMKSYVGSQKFKVLFQRPANSSSSPISSSGFFLICATLILITK